MGVTASGQRASSTAWPAQANVSPTADDADSALSEQFATAARPRGDSSSTTTTCLGRGGERERSILQTARPTACARTDDRACAAMLSQFTTGQTVSPAHARIPNFLVHDDDDTTHRASGSSSGSSGATRLR